MYLDAYSKNIIPSIQGNHYTNEGYTIYRHEAWVEVVGDLVDIQRNDPYLDVILFIRSWDKHIVLRYLQGTLESSIVKDSLNKRSIGKRIAVLRTDLQYRPIIIRILERR